MRATQERKDEALIRKEKRYKRSPEDQLALLDSRLSNGKGAAKERERLQKQIAKRLAEEQDCQEEATSAMAPKKTSSRQRKKESD